MNVSSDMCKGIVHRMIDKRTFGGATVQHKQYISKRIGKE